MLCYTRQISVISQLPTAHNYCNVPKSCKESAQKPARTRRRVTPARPSARRMAFFSIDSTLTDPWVFGLFQLVILVAIWVTVDCIGARKCWGTAHTMLIVWTFAGTLYLMIGNSADDEWACISPISYGIPSTRCVNSPDGGRSSGSEFHVPSHATSDQLDTFKRGVTQYGRPGEAEGGWRCLYGHTDLQSAAKAARWVSLGITRPGELCPHQQGRCGVAVNQYFCTCVSEETAYHAATDWVGDYATMADFILLWGGILGFVLVIRLLARAREALDELVDEEITREGGCVRRCEEFVCILGTLGVLVFLWWWHREEEDYWRGCGTGDHLDTVGIVIMVVGSLAICWAVVIDCMHPRGNMV